MTCQNRMKMEVGVGGEESRSDRKMICWSDFPHVLCHHKGRAVLFVCFCIQDIDVKCLKHNIEWCTNRNGFFD